MTTKAMLHAVSDGQWWKRSLTYLRPLHVRDCWCVCRCLHTHWYISI